MPDIRAYLTNGTFKIFKAVPQGLRSRFLQKAIKEYVENHPEEFEKEVDKNDGEKEET